MDTSVKFETVRDVAHVWVGREAIEDGGYQYVKRWKKQGMPWAEYWPVREHSLLVRLAEGDIRHVVEVIGIDARLNEVRTRDAGISLDRLDRYVQVKGGHTPHPHPFFDIAELLKLMRWSLVALEEIHGVGLVHCDLGAGNICLPLVNTGDGWNHLDYSRLMLIDFAFSLHRDLPLKYPLPLDTTAPELFYLPPFFRAAVAQDQRESRPTNGQRVATPGIDLYSLGMVTQAWYRAGVRPHDSISSARVEALFQRLASHGREGTWREVFRARGMRLIREIDRILDRAGADISRSADFRFLESGKHRVLAQTAVTPLLTRVRQPQPPSRPEPDRSAAPPMAPSAGKPLQLPSGAAATLALTLDGRIAVSSAAENRVRRWWSLPARRPGAGDSGGLGRFYSGLLLLSAAVAAVFYWNSLRLDPPPAANEGGVPAPVAPRPPILDAEQFAAALADPDPRRRGESARSLARLARETAEGGAVADRIARRYSDMLNTGAVRPDAPELHRAAWAALSTLAALPEDLAFVAAAKHATREYEGRTQELHRRLGGLIYDRQAQQGESDWNDYVLHLNTLANADDGASPGVALILGLIESTNGREADALRHMLVAARHGDARKEAGDEIGRLLQRLIDTGNRQALAAILNDVEQMAAQRHPGWQVWAARIHDALGEHDQAASWYRRVTEDQDAGGAEKDFARSEMRRLR
jgi:hypothetical protein